MKFAGLTRTIVSTIKEDIPSLSKDTCGCRVIQAVILSVMASQPMKAKKDAQKKLKARNFISFNDFEAATGGSKEGQEQREPVFVASTIYGLLRNHLIDYCINQNGNHVVQVLLSTQSLEIVSDFCRILKNYFIYLIKDLYGCRVLQKLFEAVNDIFARVNEVFEIDLSKTEHRRSGEKQAAAGVLEKENKPRLKSTQKQLTSQYVLRKCLEIRRSISDLVEILSENAKVYSVHQYANFVMQSAVKTYRVVFSNDRKRSLHVNVNKVILNDIISYSNHKYASNVVETCLQSFEERMTVELVRHFNDEQVLLALVRDQYGNYVTQTILKVVKQHELNSSIVKKIMKLFGKQRKHGYEKHIIDFIEKNGMYSSQGYF